MRAACSRAESSDEGAGERAVPVPKGDHGREDVLLAFDGKDIDLQHCLNGGSDALRRESVRALEHPRRFRHRDDADEAGVSDAQAPFDELRRTCGLHGIVLHDVADEHVRVQSDHVRRRANPPAAPAAVASSISARLAGPVPFPDGIMRVNWPSCGIWYGRGSFRSGASAADGRMRDCAAIAPGRSGRHRPSTWAVCPFGPPARTRGPSGMRSWR